ncbi:hypothetical protein CSA56_03935 [candidate division KSB3 bacterium]|uniref:Uncharacterized protein n=1 Tax=candidate division KSB3 bacterium TaxID=2044937 RepID=A0A2G6KIM5_9BACT|nr:MAG: hypothetical protein CSA56_03935 [candidate division KSB3 bacterium]
MKILRLFVIVRTKSIALTAIGENSGAKVVDNFFMTITGRRRIYKKNIFFKKFMAHCFQKSVSINTDVTFFCLSNKELSFFFTYIS